MEHNVDHHLLDFGCAQVHRNGIYKKDDSVNYYYLINSTQSLMTNYRKKKNKSG